MLNLSLFLNPGISSPGSLTRSLAGRLRRAARVVVALLLATPPVNSTRNPELSYCDQLGYCSEPSFVICLRSVPSRAIV